MGNSEINVLTGLETAKVALVNRGANKKPRFPVWKSEEIDMNEMQEILGAILEVEAENENKIEEIFKQKLSAKGVNAVKGALRLLNAYKDELPKDVMSKLATLTGGPAVKQEDKKKEETKEQKKKEEEEEAKKQKNKGKDKEKYGYPMAKALDGLDDDLRDKIEPVVKALGDARAEEIAKAEEEIQKANERAEEIAKTLKVERDLRQTKEWIAKAETDLSHYPGKSSEELGAELKSLHDHDSKMAESHFETMKTASEAIKKGDLLRQVGSPGGGAAGSAEDKLEQMAQQYVAKSSDGAMTIEKARVAVQEQHPEMYDDYLDEHPEQTGVRK